MKTRSSLADLDTFRSLLTHEVGFRFEDDKLPFLAQLLTARMLATKRSTTSAYFKQVASNPNEVAELARTLTVSETYFLRNGDHFRAFEAIVQARARRGERNLRVLSAGSSSGEEAYSLAIMLSETLANLDRWTISIVGVDLNPDVIDKARIASYPAWSLRETPEALRQKYFRKDGTRFMLNDSIRQMVQFEARNLVHATGGLWRPESYDLVFCRNVLMYFSPEIARVVIANIARSLAPEGHLFLGHAENLRGLSQDFHLCHTHGTFYYQRRSQLKLSTTHAPIAVSPSSASVQLIPRAPLSPDADLPWFEAIAQASGRIQRLSQESDAQEISAQEPDRVVCRAALDPTPAAPPSKDLAPAMDMLKQERFHEALRLLANVPSPALQDPDELLLRAMLLASTGQLDDSEALCSKLLTVDELNAGAHYVKAICREHAGDRSAAIEHSQAATYLDNDFAMPHLQLGRLARRMGNLDAARRELTLALRLLAGEDAARITLFGGGFGREVLMQLCRSEISACGVER